MLMGWKKRIFILTVILYLGIGSALAQVLVHTYYDDAETLVKEEFYVKSKSDAVLDGPYVSYFEDGVVKSEGIFSNNVSTGIWTYFYKNGKPRMSGEVREGTNFGVWSYFYETGVKKMEGLIIEGKREGPWVIYHKNQAKQSQGPFVSDRKSGTWTHFFSSGGVKAKEVFVGLRSHYTEYYKSGEEKMKGDKNSERKEGVWEFYYEDGSIEASGDFVKGKKSGNWKHYNSIGSLEAEGPYLNDQPEGLWLYYHLDGSLSGEGRLVEGAKDGKWKLYYNDGTLKGESEYVKGTGQYKEYYMDGQLKISGPVVNGKNDGKWQYFYETGELEGDCVFNIGNGKYVGYYPTGQVKMRGEIKDDLKVGIWEFYEPDGSLAGYYKPHYEEGEATFFLAEEDKKQENVSKPHRSTRGTFVYKKKKQGHFNSNLNEFRAYIIGYNPVATLFNSFPVSFEYYMEERLGYELLLQYLRDPFFKSSQSIGEGETLREGFSASIRQKFYNSESKFGVPYFGHELRYTYQVFSTTLQDIKINGAWESKYEYAGLIGIRYFKNRRESGFTVDAFVGFGLGYRDYQQSFEPTNPENDPFATINSNNFAYSIRIGVNLGFVMRKNH